MNQEQEKDRPNNQERKQDNKRDNVIDGAFIIVNTNKSCSVS